jgi:hypothetical protein
VRNILKEFEAVLPVDQFMRIHKSYIVQVSEIQSINTKEVKVGSDLVPVGRTYYHQLNVTLLKTLKGMILSLNMFRNSTKISNILAKKISVSSLSFSVNLENLTLVLLVHYSTRY